MLASGLPTYSFNALDLLQRNGKDLKSLPLEERKATLIGGGVFLICCRISLTITAHIIVSKDDNGNKQCARREWEACTEVAHDPIGLFT